MLKVQEKAKTINNAQQGEEEGITNNDKYSHLDPCIVGEAKSAVNDLLDLQQKPQDKVSFVNRIAMLNADQSYVFHRVSDHLNHQHQHETGTCKCKDMHPLHMFVRGVGGIGKSFLTEAIRAQADTIWSLQGSNSLMCCYSTHQASCIQCRWCHPPPSPTTSH